MNKPVTVRTLLGDYPVTQPLKKGEVKSPSVSPWSSIVPSSRS